ncbi:hypothetical protein [Gloeocapsa sp. PCC 73106]|uniref:hypothetical protein n=1 Tax=Gloeocapsa sp. PCC 73106 TaxID=102232 RepID=UPI0002AD086A|nr:hypothetical protein [Gloeocapsa sp. PCC 73106]ELR99756.1 hypothetical protein GLO73106DRAFT_00036080 [Gloeocapsa sp. PCC 73106]
MIIKGVVKGNLIELLEPVNISDGLEILIHITEDFCQKEPQWQELEKVIGIWKNDEEITDIFNDIDKERHLNYGKEVNLDFDN